MDDKPGFKAAVELLQHSDLVTKERILKYIAKHDPQLAERLNENLFTFEDLIFVTEKGIRLLFKNIPRETWLYAFRKISDKHCQ
jgi:flagellar motor switch protein FliG